MVLLSLALVPAGLWIARRLELSPGGQLAVVALLGLHIQIAYFSATTDTPTRIV